MCGAYDEVVHVGEIIAPQKAFVEEGTSLHYYEDIEYSKPDGNLQKAVTSLLAYATILLSRQMPYIVRRCVKNSYGEIKVLSE